MLRASYRQLAGLPEAPTKVGLLEASSHFDNEIVFMILITSLAKFSVTDGKFWQRLLQSRNKGDRIFGDHFSNHTIENPEAGIYSAM